MDNQSMKFSPHQVFQSQRAELDHNGARNSSGQVPLLKIQD